MPGTLFGGLNLIYDLEKFRPRGLALLNAEAEPLEGVPTGPCLPDADEDGLDTCVASARRLATERSSRVGVSGALAVEINWNLFVGGKIRYSRSYAGLGLDSFFEEHARRRRPDPVRQAQREPVDLRGLLDPDRGKIAGCSGSVTRSRQFLRHQAKLKISYEF